MSLAAYSLLSKIRPAGKIRGWIFTCFSVTAGLPFFLYCWAKRLNTSWVYFTFLKHFKKLGLVFIFYGNKCNLYSLGSIRSDTAVVGLVQGWGGHLLPSTKFKWLPKRLTIQISDIMKCLKWYNVIFQNMKIIPKIFLMFKISSF